MVVRMDMLVAVVAAVVVDEVAAALKLREPQRWAEPRPYRWKPSELDWDTNAVAVANEEYDRKTG